MSYRAAQLLSKVGDFLDIISRHVSYVSGWGVFLLHHKIHQQHVVAFMK